MAGFLPAHENAVPTKEWIRSRLGELTARWTSRTQKTLADQLYTSCTATPLRHRNLDGELHPHRAGGDRRAGHAVVPPAHASGYTEARWHPGRRIRADDARAGSKHPDTEAGDNTADAGSQRQTPQYRNRRQEPGAGIQRRAPPAPEPATSTPDAEISDRHTQYRRQQQTPPEPEPATNTPIPEATANTPTPQTAASTPMPEPATTPRHHRQQHTPPTPEPATTPPYRSVRQAPQYRKSTASTAGAGTGHKHSRYRRRQETPRYRRQQQAPPVPGRRRGPPVRRPWVPPPVECAERRSVGPDRQFVVEFLADCAGQCWAAVGGCAYGGPDVGLLVVLYYQDFL